MYFNWKIIITFSYVQYFNSLYRECDRLTTPHTSIIIQIVFMFVYRNCMWGINQYNTKLNENVMTCFSASTNCI